jgi:hypothetical protein
VLEEHDEASAEGEELLVTGNALKHVVDRLCGTCV